MDLYETAKEASERTGVPEDDIKQCRHCQLFGASLLDSDYGEINDVDQCIECSQVFFGM